MSRKGFTIIELVIALTIIAIVFYAFISIFSNLAPKDINARTLATGTHLINRTIEQTMLKNFTAITSTSATAFSAPFDQYYNQVIVNYVTTAELDTLAPGTTPYKRVRVLVWGLNLPTREGVTLAVTYEVRR